MVLTSGAFDGLHAGHIAYLEAAKRLCVDDELLVCAVAPDAYIAEAKGRAAHWTQRERMRTVLALGMVDAVLQQRTASVAPLVVEHRPRLFVKGHDWQGRLPEDLWHACAGVGTTVAFVETPGTHCSDTPAAVTDEQALARFEALVHGQQPAMTPWVPVTDYSLEARRAAEGEHPRLIKEVFAPRWVLDCGAGAGHLLTLLAELGVRGEGVDLQESPHPAVYQEDISRQDFDRDEVPYWPGADLVICREVLEHLTVPQLMRAVRNLCLLSDKFVYITTRFAKTPTHVFDVDTRDDLDPTHITMLTQPMLRALFVLQGLRRRADLEARLDWQHQGRVLVYETPDRSGR